MKISAPFSSLRDAFLLLLWGMFVLWISWNGQLAVYLHPALQHYAIAAGIVLLGLSGFAFRALFSRGSSVHDCCHGEGHHEHGHHHGAASQSLLPLLCKTLLLVLPIALYFSGQAGRFTLTTVQNRGVVDDLQKLPSANRTIGESPSGTTVGVMPVQVIDMLYAVQMPTYREEFEGKKVELTGQFVPLSTGNPKGDRFQAVRLFITCCAADAKPVGVTVRYPKQLKVPEMGWIRIIGTPTFPMEGGRRTAILEATEVTPCPAPDEPFLY